MRLQKRPRHRLSSFPPNRLPLSSASDSKEKGVSNGVEHTAEIKKYARKNLP
jgi:hypothetical protein